MNYLPTTEQEKKAMLDVIGVESVEELFKDIPQSVRLQRELNIPKGLSEYEVKKAMFKMAEKNRNMNDLVSFLGAGAYDHYAPTLVDSLMQRSEFYTAYTPYQPEISQGTLQSIYEFQTMVCELFAMDVANASVYDGANATVEAVAMACDRKKEVIVSKALHPEYRGALETYTKGYGVTVKYAELVDGLTPKESYEGLLSKDTGALVVQYPNFLGNIEDLQSLADLAHANGALLIVTVVDIASLGVLEAPGKLGADIVAGEGQSLSVPTSFGGPYLGLMATRDKLVRKLPGRIVGATVDTRGEKAYVLTLQAREQHIRRDKSSSNICSNEGLCALAFNMTLSTLGKKGLKEMGSMCLQKAHYAQERLSAIPGVEVAFKGYFYDEFVLRFSKSVEYVNKKLLENGILGGLNLKPFYPELGESALFCITELIDKEQIDMLAVRLEAIINE
jgi:glycine dehydrogenase subunit 1